MRKQQLFVTTVLLVLVVFVIGVFVGGEWSGTESSVESTLKQSELSAESFLVEQELFESFDTSCELTQQRLASLSDGLWRLGQTLAGPEAEEQLGVENYNFLKRKFHLMQIRAYVLYKQFLDNCGEVNVVLFYYMRGDADSERQGEILDSLVDEHDMKVFAVEYDYSKDLAFLEDYYGVETTPFLIVNYDHEFSGLTPAEDIVAVLYG